MTAFLARLLIGKKEINALTEKDDHSDKLIKRLNKIIVFNVIMSSFMAAFIMYIGSRTSLIGMFIIILFYYLIGERKIARERWIVIIRQFGLFAVSFVIAVPLLYYPICYLPLIRTAVRTEIKNIVKTTDIPVSISNENSVQLREALDNMVLRYLKSDIAVTDDDVNVEIGTITETVTDESASEAEIAVEEESPYKFDLENYPEDSENYVIEYYYAYYPERGKGVIYVPKKLYGGITSINVRINIYYTLLHNLNLAGHTSDEVIMVLRSNAPGESKTWINNEQNFIIHYLYDYGVPVGFFFCILVLASLVYLVRMAFKGKIEAFAFAMFYLVFILTGLMEVVWIPRRFPLVLLFFAPIFYYNLNSDGVVENE